MTHRLRTAAKRLLLALACAALAPAAQAQDVAPGCYERVYTQTHLAGHPAQVAREVRLWVGSWYTEVAREGVIEVVAANQGHSRGQAWVGVRLRQNLYCGNEAGEARCSATCNGGGFDVIQQDASGLLFRTDYLMVGGGAGCGAVMDMAEHPGTPVSYRLFRVEDSVCADLREK